MTPYTPLRFDLPLGLYAWLFFLGSLIGFVLISLILGSGIFWPILTGITISILSHSSWRSVSGASMMKLVLNKSLFAFITDLLRKKSWREAFHELFNTETDFDKEVEIIIQKESRWLVIIPLLLLLPTLALHWLIEASLAYFMIAEIYFSLIGLIWMIICRKGRLAMIPIGCST